LLLLRELSDQNQRMIAINGFDCFVGGSSSKVVDRMLERITDQTANVLNRFRARCGASPFHGAIASSLAKDLLILRNADERSTSARHSAPILVLHGALDPILTQAMRRRSFARAKNSVRIDHADGGHLLPLTHPTWCAEQIRAFAEGMASW
jgi:pimeloyl-[acyl-carrier protein] methyl ester esterase